MLTWLGYINLGLAAFNLVPGYPLDGGRVLRSLLWWKSGDAERATHNAAVTGQVVGGLFITLGIVQFFFGANFGGLWIAFIGWFLLQAAGETRRQAGFKRAFRECAGVRYHVARLRHGGRPSERPGPGREAFQDWPPLLRGDGRRACGRIGDAPRDSPGEPEPMAGDAGRFGDAALGKGSTPSRPTHR